jgi:hypothetical protein
VGAKNIYGIATAVDSEYYFIKLVIIQSYQNPVGHTCLSPFRIRGQNCSAKATSHVATTGAIKANRTDNSGPIIFKK